MKTDRLFINNIEVDIGDAVIGLTFQINDLSELKDRQANFSNKFKVPKTKHNTELFEWSDMVQTGTVLPYRKMPARLYKGSKALGGFAIIEATDGAFNITFYSGLIDLFELLDKKKLSELAGLSALNHYWNKDSIFDSRANFSGYVYPIVDYSDDPAFMDNVTNSMDITRNMPFVFVHSLVQMIFEEAGYTYSGKLFTGSKFPRLIMSLGNESWIFNGRLLHAARNILDPVQSGSNILAVVADNDAVPGNALAQTGNFDVNNNWTNAAGGGTFKGFFNLDYPMQVRNSPLEDQDFTLSWVLSVTATGTPGDTYVFRIRENTSSTTVYESAPATIGIGGVNVDNRTVFLPNGSYAAGSQFSCRIQWLSGSGTFDVNGVQVIAETRGQYPIKFKTDPTPIFIKDVIADMTQKEFLKGILVHLFGAFPVNEKFGAHKKFVQFKEIIENIPLAKDWSSPKMHDSQGNGKKEFRAPSYNQKNWMRWREDEGVIAEYGDGFFLIDDETLPVEGDLFTMPFAASQWAGRFEGGHKKVPLVKRWDTYGEPSYTTQPRLLLLDAEEPAVTPYVHLVDPVGGVNDDYNDVVPYAHFMDPDHTENLGFGDSVIADEYQDLIDRVLTKYKKITEQFYLNDNDINELDHTIPVHIKEHGANFYINKIPSYVGDKLTAAELIRI